METLHARYQEYINVLLTLLISPDLPHSLATPDQPHIARFC